MTEETTTVERPESAPTSGGPFLRLMAWTRFVVMVPVVGLFLGALTLFGMAGIEVVHTVLAATTGELAKKTAVLDFIELADVFLLATVLYIMALGLFELFVDDRLPLPHWLEIHTLDDLKEKLVGVVVVVLAVSFLGNVIEAENSRALLELGIGVAAVIVALSYFLGRIGNK